jgi:hypothetical protein
MEDILSFFHLLHNITEVSPCCYISYLLSMVEHMEMKATLFLKLLEQFQIHSKIEEVELFFKYSSPQVPITSILINITEVHPAPWLSSIPFYQTAYNAQTEIYTSLHLLMP